MLTGSQAKMIPEILPALVALERLLHPRDQVQDARLDLEVEANRVVLKIIGQGGVTRTKKNPAYNLTLPRNEPIR